MDKKDYSLILFITIKKDKIYVIDIVYMKKLSILFEQKLYF